jgi:hypothetical protein
MMKSLLRVWLALPLSMTAIGCGGGNANGFLPDAAQGGSVGIPLPGVGGTPSSTELPGASSGGSPGTPPGGTGGALGSTGMPDAASAGGTGPGLGGAGGASALDGGLTDASGSDPCKGVSIQGRCLPESNAWESCAVPTGNGSPLLLHINCGTAENCVMGAFGPTCAAKAGTCANGATQCAGNQLQVCQGSTWANANCTTTCRTSAIGAFCPGKVATATYTATIQYQAQGPNADYSDWTTTPTALPASSLLVVSLHGSDVVDAQLSDENGVFSLAVPTPFAATDTVAALLLYPNADNTDFAFAVVDPDVGSGVRPAGGDPGSNAQIWLWSIDPATSPSGSTLLITEALGSGAVRLYDYLRFVYLSTWKQYAVPGPSLAVLLQLDTDWDCGACFVTIPIKVGDMAFASRIMIPATAQDTDYWSDAVIAHELGHWVMAAYGVSPGEGGPHFLGQPSFPGLAWSEGWATGFSSLMRNDSLYYDKQQGSMFWWDLQSRSYSATAWVRPTAAKGLLQEMDENEVAAMLWDLGTDSQVGASTVLEALRSPRMKTSPFARGYTRHQWKVAADGSKTAVVDTGKSAPMVADFLDALVCSSVPAKVIDSVTVPTTYYPYPSSAPICQ